MDKSTVANIETSKTRDSFFEAQEPWKVIAANLYRSADAAKKKCKRLGLEVVGAKGYKTTTSLKFPKELPSVEDALNLLVLL
jgi:hypothetical protein